MDFVSARHFPEVREPARDGSAIAQKMIVTQIQYRKCAVLVTVLTGFAGHPYTFVTGSFFGQFAQFAHDLRTLQEGGGMKTERRHELQTNTLADALGQAVDTVKPYSQMAVGAVLAVAVIVLVVKYLSFRRRKTWSIPGTCICRPARGARKATRSWPD